MLEIILVLLAAAQSEEQHYILAALSGAKATWDAHRVAVSQLTSDGSRTVRQTR